MKPQFDIILVSYGHAEMVAECVRSIEAHTDEDEARLIWIENIPSESALDIVSVEKIPCMAIPLMENIDWVKSVNLGLAISTASFVVIMNSDTEVMTDGWLPKMAEGFNGSSKTGIVCPRHDKPWGLGLMTPDEGLQPIKPNWSVQFSGIGSPGTGFFCAMLPREAITEIGYLDEHFVPIYGDDDDWAFRAWLKGYRFLCQTDVMVKHRWGGSHSAEFKARVQPRNAKYLREKWQHEIERILLDNYPV